MLVGTMADSKIKISIGTITFQAEGGQQWVGEQLDKLFSNAKELASVAPAPTSRDVADENSDHTPIKSDANIAAKPLASFLKDKNATSKQVLKFLATAVWLESKGNNRLSTSDITQALRDANQNKLNNAADCLNQNVKKGFCEKEGTQFFVTMEGKESL